jgi:group II intron reverse transcriptase/maturase
VKKAKQYIQEGYTWVVDIDLEKFFDRVNHDKLMGILAKRIPDKILLKLIRKYLQAGVMINGVVMETQEGTPQGGPLSPLLSNILLDELDKELEKRGHKFVRYADDCNIYVRKKAGERVMKSITAFIEKKLRLKVNETKSAVDRPWRRKFLGFSFTPSKEPKNPNRKGKHPAHEAKDAHHDEPIETDSHARTNRTAQPVHSGMVWILFASRDSKCVQRTRWMDSTKAAHVPMERVETSENQSPKTAKFRSAQAESI